PLCDRAHRLLKSLPREHSNSFVFIGPSRGSSLSNMAMLKTLQRMGRGDLTVHGFRSTFRDWAAERTNYPNHVVEMALAHPSADNAEGSYRRGGLCAKRGRLMADWAKFCSQPTVSGGVIPLRKASR